MNFNRPFFNLLSGGLFDDVHNRSCTTHVLHAPERAAEPSSISQRDLRGVEAHRNACGWTLAVGLRGVWFPGAVRLCGLCCAALECPGDARSGARLPLLGLPVPAGFLVVRSTSPDQRTTDLLAHCPCHRAPTNPVHLCGFDPCILSGGSMHRKAMEGLAVISCTILSETSLRHILLFWIHQVPLLNVLDCWMSYCILILVVGSALYFDPISKGALQGRTSTQKVSPSPPCRC